MTALADTMAGHPVTNLAATTSRDALRVAVIGSGKMGHQHLRAIRAVGGASVVAVADPAVSREQLEGLVPDGAQLFTDPEEMLRTVRPDVVHVVTPPHTHATLAESALRAGSHVYVEKPFTARLAEAEAIVDLAAARGLQVCAGHQCLAERAASDALRAIPEIGRLVHVESFLSFRTVRRSITPVEQAKDILPHAVYPVVAQLRAATGLGDPITVTAIDARADGDIHALLRLGPCTAVIVLTLNGRPREQYQQRVGTRGSIRADYITGGIVKLAGPGTGVGVLFTPWRRSLQTIRRAASGAVALLTGKAGSYRGLGILIGDFYDGVRAGRAPSFLTPGSILDTVAICERIGSALDEAERDAENDAMVRLAREEAALAGISGRSTVLVTGGTGFLGRRVAQELIIAGFGVRVIARRVPRAVDRIAGVEYVAADLARPLDPRLWHGVDFAVHCAAETAGGREDHERNSIDATRNVLEAAGRAGVTRVVYVSSLAILKRTRGALDERTPVDVSLERGPYVWGKASAERVAQERAGELGVQVKIIRPGPLVDYADFSAPGRLGRELGPIYVAIGGRRSPLSVCDVGTAGCVIRSYIEDFDAAPALVNLVESPAPTRRDLAQRLRAARPDLRVVWIPGWAVRLLNGPAKLLQRVVFGSARPIDVYAAFASERYQTDAAARVIERARATRGSASTEAATA